jgi:hypothetical protein
VAGHPGYWDGGSYFAGGEGNLRTRGRTPGLRPSSHPACKQRWSGEHAPSRAV